jgi:hypothetical protein
VATATDDFNRADGALGANWTTAHNGGGKVLGNAYAPVTNYTSEAALYSGTAFTAMQYSQAKRASFGEFAGLAVRMSVGGNYYAWFHNGTLQKFVGGTGTTLGTFATFGVGPVVRLQIVGNTLEGFISGASQFTFTDSTSPLTTGQPGLATYNMADGCKIDDWEGGDLPPTIASLAPVGGAPGTTVPVTITGNAFASGATVAVSGTGVTVGSVVVVSATSITANVVIAGGAAVGVRAVTVTTPGGTSGGSPFILAGATATDDFNRADGGPGANWTLIQGSGMTISGNGVVPVGSSETGHYWNAGTLSAAHVSQVKRTTTGNYGGPAVRCSAGGNGIVWFNNGVVRRIVAGGVTPLTSQATFASGDVASLSITGTTLEFFKNGVSVGTLVDAGAPVGGRPGIIFFNNLDSPGVKLDDWTGGDLAVAVAAVGRARTFIL